LGIIYFFPYIQPSVQPNVVSKKPSDEIKDVSKYIPNPVMPQGPARPQPIMSYQANKKEILIELTSLRFHNKN